MPTTGQHESALAARVRSRRNRRRHLRIFALAALLVTLGTFFGLRMRGIALTHTEAAQAVGIVASASDQVVDGADPAEDASEPLVAQVDDADEDEGAAVEQPGEAQLATPEPDPEPEVPAFDEDASTHDIGDTDDPHHEADGQASAQNKANAQMATHVIAVDDAGYAITVTYGPEAQLPSDASLIAAELGPGDEDYDRYLAESAASLGADAGQIGYVRIFDIAIVDGAGAKVQPAAPVLVSVELADGAPGEELSVVHFAEDAATGDVVEVLEAEEGTVSFEAEGFSAYAIVAAPDPVAVGWHTVASIDELLAKGASEGLYIGHPDGYYYGNTPVDDGSRVGIAKTKPATSAPPNNAAKYYFELVEGTTDQVYAYCHATGDITTRLYVHNDNDNSLLLTTDESERTAFKVERNSNGTFKLSNGAWYWNMQGGPNGSRFCSYNSVNDVNNNVNLWYYEDVVTDPYGFDGKAYGLMYWDETPFGKAMMAADGGTVAAEAMTVLATANNADHLFVPKESDISMWTFHWKDDDRYTLSVEAGGTTYYLRLGQTGVSLVTNADEATQVQLVPGTGAHAGQVCLKADNGTTAGITLTYSGTVADGFAVNGAAGSEWLNLVGLSELSDDYFQSYSARKVSVSDEGVTTGSKVIVYTRSWNDTTKKYEYYAIGPDGELTRCYESGDVIEWTGGMLNKLLWQFTEYAENGEPTYYYELYNEYGEQYLAPQVTDGQVVSPEAIGINLSGRRDGRYYSTIMAWDDPYYAYAGLKVENGRIVSCSKNESMDFYFAIVQDLEVDDTLHTVATVDHTQYGITMKMYDFPNRATMSNFLDNDQGGAVTTLQQGLLSTDLGENGYPTAKGGSLATLFADGTEVNQLFVESTYRETGYYEFDSAQNFATLLDGNGNVGTTFTVYKELGTFDSGDGGGGKPTLKHGQFFPYNRIVAGRFASLNGKNLYSTTGQALPDGDPRKYEKLYLVEGTVDHYFGVELEASFTQTPDGLDDWGHDIIFEFTGDDDFWLYVDDELVIDLGGIHSAVPGSVNFSTGQVNVNGQAYTLRQLFGENYRARHPEATAEEVAAYLAEYFEDGSDIFKPYSTHTMKIFYMERGAGASNLHMRFNLASVKPGTVELTKELAGVTDLEESVLSEFAYQVRYKTKDEVERLLTNSVPGGSQPDDYVFYKNSDKAVTYLPSHTIGDVEYKDVFIVKPGETVVISFPEEVESYSIVECGVNTQVFKDVLANGTALTGTDEAGSGTYSGHADYATPFEATDARPRVTYTNEVDPEALRTLTFRKVLLDETGENEVSNDTTPFSFRLYLGTESDDPDSLPVANMYTYHVKDRDGHYCTWDAAGQAFVSTDKADYSLFATSAEREAVSFHTSINGAISKIPAGYTVEVRDLLVGTKYRVVERPTEVPDGYSFQRYDYYEAWGGDNTEPSDTYDSDAWAGVTGTIAMEKDPHVDIRNLKGWGLRMYKVWTDASYMSSREATYFAVFTRSGVDGELSTQPVADTVRRLDYNANPQTLYWYFERLVSGTNGVSDYAIREVRLTGANIAVSDDGVVTGYDTVAPIAEGKDLTLTGTQKGETSQGEFTYTVSYAEGEVSGGSNVRVDTVTNDRPGIIIRKTDWEGAALAGATFTLTEENGEVIGTFTSDGEGNVTTAFLAQGKTYELGETRAPAGYHGLQDAMTIAVASDGMVTVSGADTSYYTWQEASTTPAILTIKNRPFTLRAVKLDGDTESPVAGATFDLYRQMTVNGRTDFERLEDYSNLTTGADGVIPRITEELPVGTYELHEVSVGGGYERLEGPTGYIRFTISPTGAVTLGTQPAGVTLASSADDDGLAYTLTVLNYRKTDLVLQKVSDTDQPLTGAEFALCKLDENGAWQAVEGSGTIDMGTVSQVTLSGLGLGRYRLTETKAPSGYVILARDAYFELAFGNDGKPIITIVDASGTELAGADSMVSASGTTITVKNVPGAALPSAGGSGVQAVYLLGVALVAAGLMGLARRRGLLGSAR